jgi:hypothetical protein
MTDTTTIIESQSATIARLEAELERVTGERDRHRDELENIANANPSTWESPSDFAAWARNRARHSLSGGSARYPALAARENEDSNG